MSGDYQSGWGGHGTAEISLRPDSRFDLRGTASLAVGGFEGAVGTGMFGLDALGVMTSGTFTRPYVGAGLGYSWTDASAGQPLAYSFGVTGALGVEWGREGASWFIEGRTRLFGNVFESYSVTRSVLLVSVGRTIH